MNNDMLPARMTANIKPEAIKCKGGDLINRDALKKALNFVYNCAYIDSRSKEGIASDIIAEIDNAPAVECLQFNIFCENADEQAIADMRAELKRVLNEIRPEGEWIDDSPTSWKCSCCGYGVNRWNNTPFCPNCGIKVQHTEKEQ